MAHEKVHVLIDKNSMTAKIRLRGAYDPTVTFSAIVDQLNEKAVTFGVDFKAVEAAVKEFETKGRLEDEVVVARGTPVVESVDGKVEMFVKEPERVSIDDSGQADFRNIHRFTTVKKDEPLARVHLPIEGKAGMNVFGNEIEPRVPSSPSIDGGDHVRIETGDNIINYFADAKGVFIKRGKVISVSPVLYIEKSVGLETGNIEYDGDISIRENIERGSALISSGNVTVKGGVESGNIKVGGNFNVKTGINTKNEGRILVKGDVDTGYIDNTKMFVAGSLYVEKAITISNIITHGEIRLAGPHATISGGEITAFGSIEADIIGSKAELPMTITLGVHYERSSRLKKLTVEFEKTKKDFERLTDEIQKIKLYVQRMRHKITEEKKEELRLKLQEYQSTKELGEKLEREIQELRTTRFNQHEVRLIARDTLYPGVTIHYRNHVEKITAPLTKCVFLFSPMHEKPEMIAYTDE